jgi:hypothetical protein
MDTKQFQLSESELDQMNRFAMSISHQSIQIAKAHLQIQDMESGLRSLFAAQKQYIHRCASEHDIDPNTLGPEIQIDNSGAVTVQLQPAPVAPVPDVAADTTPNS